MMGAGSPRSFSLSLMLVPYAEAPWPHKPEQEGVPQELVTSATDGTGPDQDATLPASVAWLLLANFASAAMSVERCAECLCDGVEELRGAPLEDCVGGALARVQLDNIAQAREALAVAAAAHLVRGALLSCDDQGPRAEIDESNASHFFEQGFTEAHIRHWWSLLHCVTLYENGRVINAPERRGSGGDEKRIYRRDMIAGGAARARARLAVSVAGLSVLKAAVWSGVARSAVFGKAGGPAQAGWSGGSHYAAASQGGPQNGGRPGDWHCGTEGCKNNSVNLVYGSKANCPLCGGEKPDVPVQPKPRWAADSRWATDAAVSVAPSPEAAAASEEKAVALETAEAQLRAAGLDSEADKLAQQAAEHRAAAATLESAAVQAAAAEEKAAALEASAAQLHAAGLVAEASQLQQQAAEHRRPHVVPPARGRPAWSGGVPPPPAAPHPGFAGAYGRGRGDAHHWPPPPHGGKGHGKGKDGKGGGHPGDWHCANPECKNYQDNVVFASKQACPICGTPKPMIGVGYPNKRSENDWQCPNTTCKNHTNFVYGSKPACTICGMPNPNLEGGAAERDHSRTPRGDHGEPHTVH
ncbi:unnamed protein product [Prorocentrum cordatum]|uniref:RanBP2-type domain-containing protein n=1 Tax=Prorocentrum cordatum TaxID=2364126 RepID=A0ABN9VV35_9DINO|nr:unnamed protein product [Polarella glacialis]